MSSEPKRPDTPRAIAAWLDLHVPRGLSLECVTGAPPPVAEWIVLTLRWRAEREAWAAAQPIDYDDARGPRGCWRMFGGEWMPAGEFVEASDADGLRFVEHAERSANEAMLRLTPDEFRAWAAEFYQRHQAIERAKSALLAHLRGRHA